MTPIEMQNQKMVCLFAPDGNIQPFGMSETMEESLAMIELFASTGMGQSMAQMWPQGFELRPIEISFKVIGTEEDAYNEMQKRIKS